MKAPLRALLAACALLTWSVSAQTPQDVRVALVIGNAAYAAPMTLANPANDARAMSETLKGLGFSVIEVRDGSREQMAQGLSAVREQLKGRQGIGMLYYAGHGLQVDARNFMVPVDARLRNAGDVSAQTMDVGQVVEAFKAAGNRMNILVLDACRDNPFGGITSGKGLAPLDAPSGTFLAYATAPGNVAEDGDVKSGNGLYTQFLLAELKKPQARIEDVFKRVRFAVRKASSGRQIPWESTSLEDDFSFNDGRIARSVPPDQARLAASFSEEKQQWDRIRDSSNADDFYAFLQKYPSGTIAEAAQARLGLLNKTSLVVQGASADGRDQAYTRSAYRLGDEFTLSAQDGSFQMRQQVTKVSASEVVVRNETLIGGKPSPGGVVTELYDGAGGMRGIEGQFHYEPPQYFMPADLVQVGRSWKMAYEVVPAPGSAMPRATASGEGRVLARESLTLPVGTFQTFKIEFISFSSAVKNSGTRCLFWFSSEIPTWLKMECVGPPINGKPFTYGMHMTAMKRAS